jgi:hypothetical protein
VEFGRVTKVLDDEGNLKYRQIYITKDVVLKQGDKVYLNDVEDSLQNKVKYGIITEDEKVAKLSRIQELDKQFNRETTFVLKKAKAKPVEG